MDEPKSTSDAVTALLFDSGDIEGFCLCTRDVDLGDLPRNYEINERSGEDVSLSFRSVKLTPDEARSLRRVFGRSVFCTLGNLEYRLREALLESQDDDASDELLWDDASGDETEDAVLAFVQATVGDEVGSPTCVKALSREAWDRFEPNAKQQVEAAEFSPYYGYGSYFGGARAVAVSDGTLAVLTRVFGNRSPFAMGWHENLAW